jgi:hypothetical protein
MIEQPKNTFVFDKQILPGPEDISTERKQEIDPIGLKGDLQAYTDNLTQIFSVLAAVLFFFLFSWFLSKSP